MLQLKSIVKNYQSADLTVNALKGITVNFRKNEFVSVLGPSGCGKTTLLNIIGGLDGYTSGDLIIEGRSTKDYKSRDWDRYRNKTIGFVFQSYNLIPHISVQQNVELALTISGISRKDKRALAVDALTKVGLGAELKKKPNELSGGQMQRVAIARAIVNDPEIILADEPTGALDTATSRQVMDILKEISRDKLVIMVTHNPELAYQYSTRIIEMRDGVMEHDSAPYDPDSAAAQEEDYETAESAPADSDTDIDKARRSVMMTSRKSKKHETSPRASMSFLTSLSLSARNLLTKKVRTAITVIAGSIGIIGIALVLSLTNGFNLYMDDLEQTTLATMPIQISSMGVQFDMDDMMDSMTGGSSYEQFPDSGEVLPYDPDSSMGGVSFSANFITEDYVEYIKGLNTDLVSSIQYRNNMTMNLLSKKDNGVPRKVHVQEINWQELLWDSFTNEQYDVLEGGYPGTPEAEAVLKEADRANFDSYKDDPSQVRARQAVLVISSANRIEKSILDALGYDIGRDTSANKYYPIKLEDLLGRQIKVAHHDDFYDKTEDGTFAAADSDEYAYIWEESDKTIPVTICGVLRVKEGATFSMLSRGIGYTEDLTEIVLNNNRNSEIGQAQIADTTRNVLTGKKFSIDLSSIVSIFESFNMSEEKIVTELKKLLKDNEEFSAVYELIKDCETIQEIADAVSSDPKLETAFKLGIALMMDKLFDIDVTVTLRILNNAYESALQRLGASELPSSIYIYPNSFENKQLVLDYLDAWNEMEGHGSADKVTYTDLASTMSIVMTQVVDIVSYILIAFAAISLIVSGLMISIITYVSVLERTTEIGVLRAIGARKVDIANVFNAETVIIGIISGALGVFLAWIIDFPLNALLFSLVPQAPPSFAVLNPVHGILLVLLSMVITVIAGLIPASMAAKKDPVKALRSTQ